MSAYDEKIFRTSSYRPFLPAQIGWKEMRARISQRRYLPTPLTDEECAELERILEQHNRKTGLHFSLICNRSDVFTGHISTAHNYLVLAGQASDKHLEERCGYYGEAVVLAAAALGLATCWVGGTYDRNACLAHLGKGERLVCVIAVGHSANTSVSHAPHRSTKSPHQLSTGLDQAPDWFRDAITAVQLAPSAMNRQGVSFTWQEDGTVIGTATDSESFSMVDLGIAKLHFELGAHGGDWEWGSGATFRRALQEKSCGAVVYRTKSGHREYLIIRHNGGHWSFPKGHVENNETEEETAMREILEETGLTTAIDTSFRSVVTYCPKIGVAKDVVFFVANVTGGTERPQEEEIAQLEWLPYKDAHAIITFPADARVLADAEEFLAKKA